MPASNTAAAALAGRQDHHATGAMQHHELLLGRFLQHAAKWHPRAGIVTGGGAGVAPTRLTYAELLSHSAALSGALASAGLTAGDRIATLAWNSQDHFIAWFAALGIGVSVHTLNPRLAADQLADMVRQAEDRMLIASPDQTDAIEAIVATCPTIERVLILDEVGNAGRLPDCRVPVTTLAAFGNRGGVAHWGGFSESAEAGLCFTSGTTGAPKGVAYTHRSNYLVTLNLLQADVMAIGARDTILAAVPMFHANAWGIPFAAPAAGARLVLPGRHTDGAHLAQLIAGEGVTLALGVPTVWLQLLDHLDATDGHLPSLERVVVGGSSIPQALLDRIETRLKVRALTSWGMTELSPLGTLVPATSTSHDAKLSGKVTSGVDLLLKDADGAALPEQRGVEGRLHVRGPSAVGRYLGHAESATDADGWFDTGDLAVIDRDGNLAITGRAKDLIKSGGEWINPAEIEAIVGALPAIALVAVIARAHPKWGERPVVVIETVSGQSIDDAHIVAALADKVPRWWLPEEIIRVDAMPLALTGKLDKQKLRQLHGATQS